MPEPRTLATRTDAAVGVLHILHLEDDALDAELASATLVADGLKCTFEVVASRTAFEAALTSTTFDVILSDYNLPGFDGLTAQGIAARFCPNVPFIFLSGALGDDLAADCMKEGATDFVLKQRIAKLPLAIRRARRESDLREDRRCAEEALRAANVELEERVQQRSAALTATTTALARREAELEVSQQHLAAILEYSPHAIQVKDLEGRYVVVNPAAQRVLARAEVIGKTVHDMMPPRLADVIRAHDQQVIAKNRSAHFEESVVTPDGVHVFASTRFPLYDAAGQITGVCGISQDITADKHANDEIKLARLEALRATLAKNVFLSQVSHELRTPLNAILGFAQLFAPETLTAEQSEGIAQILSAGRHLLDLINEVIDIARVESGKLALSPEPVDVDDVVRSTVELVRPLAAGRGLTLTVADLPVGLPSVRADRQRLCQVLLNLLSNAVKYNRPQGRVTVDFELVPPQRFRIAVSDTGAGIPPEQLKLLFQPFERLGAERTAVEGTGLGLALSRALCEAMDGTLGVESSVDAGSRFWIELPLADRPVAVQAAAAAAAAAYSPAANVRGTVLYVEDNASNVRLMERILGRLPGVTLIIACDGAAGLAAVDTQRPDVILLDMQLPDMSGEEVLRRLWENPATRRIPVAVLTADATPGLPRRLKAAGAATFLAKPLNVRQVLHVVDDLLAQSRG